MCNRCHDTINRDMGIRDTDLQYLPYKLVKWMCIFPGCNNGCRVRDYGIPGYYYDKVKRKTTKRGWRVGWFSEGHTYACSKHFKMIKQKQIDFPDTSYAEAKKKFKPI